MSRLNSIQFLWLNRRVNRCGPAAMSFSRLKPIMRAVINGRRMAPTSSKTSHFAGVTNATLTIANAQPEDTGDYAVIAENPDSPLASAAAVLSVFKPIQLSLTPSLVDGSHQLVVTHQDGSPLDTNDVSHLVIFTTTNLKFQSFQWEVATNTGIVSNGIYQVDFPADGNAVRFWQVGQQP